MKVEVRELKKVYGGRVVLYVPRLSLDNGIYVIRGPNGSGKSTFLKVLAGIVRPTSGTVRVLGRDPFKDLKVRKRISFVGHRTGLIEDLNGHENARLFLCGPFKCEKLSPFLKLAKELKVHEVLHRPVRTYSRGEKTKLSIAIAMAYGGEILLLDEPFAPLDTTSRDALSSLLKGVASTIIITAHGDIPDMGGRTIKFPLSAQM